MFDVCVIGGGASGMAAAIAAAEENSDLSVVLLEKNSNLGKKLIATGNGRCNLSNSEISNCEVVSEFFDRIGLFIRTEEQGRMYPYSGKARDVLKALTLRMESLGIKVVTDYPVVRISEITGGFSIAAEKSESIEAAKVVLATGGKAAPQYGCTGDGYALAKKMGHNTKRLAPGLTWLACKEYDGSLKGLRVKAKISLMKKDHVVKQEEGELQFTGEGLSGICIFNLSNYVVLDHETGFSDYVLSIDFMPGFSAEQIVSTIKNRLKIESFGSNDLLLSVVPEPLGQEILRRALRDDSVQAHHGDKTSKHKAEKIATQLKDFRYIIQDAGGWKDAQITRGGIVFNEIHPITMESLVIPGVFIAGELLEYAGPCGGFNLYHAWNTGLAAGKNSAINAGIEYRREDV